MAELKIPQKTLQDNFNLQDFKDDFNALNSEIEENKTLTNSEISRLKEIANTWEAFKNNGGVINGDVDFSTGLNARRVSLKNDQNDFFSFITLNDTTIGIKFNDSILQTLDRFGEFYIGGYSKEPNGYTKLPNGLIMQWGRSTIQDDKWGVQAHYPINFPNACLNVMAVPHSDGTSPNISVTDFTNTWVKIRGSGGFYCMWMAIGY